MRSPFVDEVTILIRSGNGGAGCISFRREKHVEYGGPDGGQGGHGGDVRIGAKSQLSTLLDYRFKSRHFAANGAPGEGRQCSGADGVGVFLPVPVGTIIYDADTNELLADLTVDGAEFGVAHGGRGGKGNEHFKSSRRQTPRFAQPGEPGEERRLRLELKLLADVGLIGMPSVGKSSLIAKISAARPKIADYPFTTLVPNLGVVQFGRHEHFVVADVPGLIVGAHRGAGLGSRFLRHVERVRCLVHMVTVMLGDETRDPIADFEAIEAELLAHNPALASVPCVLVLNRLDLPDVAAAVTKMRQYAEAHELAFFAISAATGAGVQDLVNFLGQHVQDAIALSSSAVIL